MERPSSDSDPGTDKVCWCLTLWKLVLCSFSLGPGLGLGARDEVREEVRDNDRDPLCICLCARWGIVETRGESAHGWVEEPRSCSREGSM